MYQTAMKLTCGLVLAGVLVGCEATAKSDLAEPRWQPTASYEIIMAEPVTPSPILSRDWAKGRALYETPVVTHFGSYFEDPCVYKGDCDDAYGWTYMDYLAIVYSPARFAVNTIAVPISMIKEPPCVLQTTCLDQPIVVCDPWDACPPAPVETTKALE